MFLIFFFFQAEDGIRDLTVTGVQTCALPIFTNAHLFGAAPALKQEGADAPQTSMPLVLTGIIAGNDPQNGLAILGQSAQTAKVYAVGDGVPGGAKQIGRASCRERV